MLVLLPHIAVIVCSIYTMLVNKASEVDVLTDGKMGSREMEMEMERGENSHRSTFMVRQADKQTKVERK